MKPLMHICPRLTGNSGSALMRSWVAAPRAVVDVTSMPHWNAQYGQCVLTVSDVTAAKCGAERDIQASLVVARDVFRRRVPLVLRR